MRESTVARVYAETLVKIAQARDALDEVAAEVRALREAFEAAPRLRRFLESPEITLEDKIGALRRSTGRFVSRDTQRFLEVVVQRGRQELLPLILEAFTGLVEELRNRERVAVISAVPLSDDLRRRLVSTFARATGREIVLQESVDASLLGGFVVQVRDTRIDGSLRTRLDNLRERMLRGARAATAAS